MGFSDIPAPISYPIHYYTQLKDHTNCCKIGQVIEYVDNITSPQRRYLLPTIENNIPKEISTPPCFKGQPLVQDHYGFDSVYYVVQHFRPDIVIPVNDIWGLYNINHLKNRSCYKYIAYLAIDSECLFPVLQAPDQRPGLPPIETIREIGTMDKAVVFTNWAKEVINKTCRVVTNGRELNNISVIPHGTDTDIWKPLSVEEIKAYRQKYFNIDDNVFLVGTVSRNQSRKRFDAIFMTLRKFIDKYERLPKKVMCYFHCALEDIMGWDLQWLATYYGLQDRVIFDKSLKPGMGPTNQQLNTIINCFDTHILLSNSEGHGLSISETSAAGIPNLVSNYSAHADWGKGTLMYAKIAEYEHEPRTGFIKAVVDTDHTAHQLNLLYNSKKLREDYSKKGIALGKKLDWKNVCKEWESLLDSIDISNLKSDRYDNPDVLPIAQPQQSQFQLKYLPS